MWKGFAQPRVNRHLLVRKCLPALVPRILETLLLGLPVINIIIFIVWDFYCLILLSLSQYPSCSDAPVSSLLTAVLHLYPLRLSDSSKPASQRTTSMSSRR